MRTIYLLRHCEVEQRYDGVFRGGKLDCDLSEQGKQNAQQRADFLLEKGVDLNPCALFSGTLSAGGRFFAFRFLIVFLNLHALSAVLQRY